MKNKILHYTYKDTVIGNLQDTFVLTNKMVGNYCQQSGIPLSFNFNNKNNKALYKNYFIYNICELIKNYSNKQKTIFYNDITAIDPFRQKLVNKMRQILGIKVFSGTWNYSDFCTLLKTNDTFCTEQLDILIECDCKPKSFKHIKKYLEKEGLIYLNDSYFEELSNMMTILC